jgi:hypothetical protein
VKEVIDEAIELLYKAIGVVEFNQDFSQVLERRESLNQFLCAILNVSAAVTSCLAVCIAVVKNWRESTPCPSIC